MTLGTRIYWVLALVAVLAVAGAVVTLTSGLTSAGGSDPTPAAQTCDQQDEADDASEEADEGTDTDATGDGCGDQGEGEDGADEAQVAAGQIDDGAELLAQASITLDRAIAAAQSAASGALGEVDLERYQGKLVFNVEIGGGDVKVDAANGAILGVESDD